MNAGGGAYTDPQGRVWSADYGFTGGNTYSVTTPISGTDAQPLYQSERWSSETLRYQFTALPGTYQVNLKFAEISFTQAGQRVFDIKINGQTVLANFDVVVHAGGPNIAVDRRFAVTVPPGGNAILIELVPLVPSNPKISAIEITADDPHFRAAGRVVGLVRRL